MELNKMRVLITGGAGFIGSALVRYLVNHSQDTVINVDKLTYSGNLNSIAEVSSNKRYFFEQVDICSENDIRQIFIKHQPDAVMHLAAETHVDRSIAGPAHFIHTNILGTFVMLQEALAYWQSLPAAKKTSFRFHHISTDEVYGDLQNHDDFFTENTAYAPSSPYSASKASADHLVRAWHRTYGLPILITNCSNNYGPFQFPEKLVPVIIANALAGKPIPVYGNGKQVRDWLYVDDHVQALHQVILNGKPGSTYTIGGHTQKENIEVIHTICALLEELAPQKPLGVTRYADLIHYIKDRPGHDTRYAIDATKIKNELGWIPKENFTSGMKKTVLWYLENQAWFA